MRIAQLDCLAFGPFTNQQLFFGEDPRGFHLVYGPNEAGKTSALRALRQLLYGIPHVSSDSFKHANSELRIGATLIGGEGQRLTLIRRKGKKNTLRGADDNELIDPEVLTAFLPNVDEEMFRRQFGIDYHELVAGGQAVGEGQGDLGELLFSAGAGVAGLGRIQKQLENEAIEIFAPRATTSRINKLLTAFKQSRERLQSLRLPTVKYVQRDEEHAAVRKELSQVHEQLRALLAENHRLRRFHDAMPLVADLQRWQANWSEYGDATVLPPDAAERRLNNAKELLFCQETMARIERALAESDKELAELTVSLDLLASGDEIEALKQALGSYLKAQRDRAQLAVERDGHNQAANELLSEILGRAATLDETSWKHLSGAERIRLQNLSIELNGLEGRREVTTQQLRELEDRQRRTQQAVAEFFPAADSQDLRRALRRANQHLHLEQRLTDDQRQLHRETAELKSRLLRLPHFAGTMEQLETLAVPAVETIERFELEWTAAVEKWERSQERLQELESQKQDAERRWEKSQFAQDVPTLDDLHQVRTQRDAAWQVVREALNKGDKSGAGRSITPADADELAENFERSMQEADRLADRLRNEAERVAAKEALIRLRQQLNTQIAEQLVAVEACARRRAVLESEWQQLWQPGGITPQTPREMRAWAGRQAEMADAAADLRLRGEEAERLRATLEQERQLLLASLRAQGSSVADAEEMSLSSLLELAQERLDALEEQANQREQREHDLRQISGEIPRLQATLDSLEAELGRVRVQWEAAMKRLYLPAEASPAEANEVLQTMERIREHEREASNLRTRIAGIDRDAEAFHRDLRELVQRIAPDCSTATPSEAVAQLYRQWQQAQQRQKLRERATAARDKLLDERERVTVQAAEAQAALAALVAAAGCSSVDQLPRAEHRSARRKELELEKRRLDEQLSRLASNEPLVEFLAAAAAQDGDALQGRLAEQVGQIQTLEQRREQLATQIGSLEAELRQLDGGDQAARVDEEMQGIVAQLQTETERFQVVRSAAVVLRRAIERYREKSQGPVLQRASEYFAQLTCGSFEGLRVEYGDQDKPYLVGVRGQTRQTVEVGGMSTGTRDQLYLALRLASLEHYLDQHSPVPFVVDDILVQFDNDRAAAALRVLADLAQRTQVIFFTHHYHLVELAQQTLPVEELTVLSIAD